MSISRQICMFIAFISLDIAIRDLVGHRWLLGVMQLILALILMWLIRPDTKDVHNTEIWVPCPNREYRHSVHTWGIKTKSDTLLMHCPGLREEDIHGEIW
jgi:hypothetical protein